jgi:hypothetical protein
MESERELDRIELRMVEGRSTKNTVLFEIIQGFEGPVGPEPLGRLGVMYVSKSALAKIGKPKMIKVTIEPA